MEPASPGLISLAYFSQSWRPFDNNALRLLLKRARGRNINRGITGMLLHSRGCFLQILEGSYSSVSETITRIERDPRHHHLCRLAARPIKRREFSEWSMAFSDVSQTPGIGFNELLTSSSKEEEFQKRSELAYRLVLEFKANYSEAADPTLAA